MVNLDRYPELNRRYDLDGEYVPRTFVLDRSGKLVQRLNAQRNFPAYFFAADDIEPFVSLMRAAAESGRYDL